MPKLQTFIWKKSPQFRAFQSTNQAIQTANLGGGQKIIIRFANVATDIEKETFPIEDIQDGFKTVGPSTHTVSEPYKLEEASVEMTPGAAAGLIIALLQQAPAWPEAVQKRILTATTQFKPKATTQSAPSAPATPAPSGLKN